MPKAGRSEGLLTLATVLLGCFFGISDQMLQLQALGAVGRWRWGRDGPRKSS